MLGGLGCRSDCVRFLCFIIFQGRGLLFTIPQLPLTRSLQLHFDQYEDFAPSCCANPSHLPKPVVRLSWEEILRCLPRALLPRIRAGSTMIQNRQPACIRRQPDRAHVRQTSARYRREQTRFLPQLRRSGFRVKSAPRAASINTNFRTAGFHPSPLSFFCPLLGA